MEHVNPCNELGPGSAPWLSYFSPDVLEYKSWRVVKDLAARGCQEMESARHFWFACVVATGTVVTLDNGSPIGASAVYRIPLVAHTAPGEPAAPEDRRVVTVLVPRLR